MILIVFIIILSIIYFSLQCHYVSQNDTIEKVLKVLLQPRCISETLTTLDQFQLIHDY